MAAQIMATTLERIATKDAGEKPAREPLSVLQLAEELDSVASERRRAKMDRTNSYDWKRRFQLYGLTGLRDLQPVRRKHPSTTPRDVEEQILTLPGEHPSWGSVHLSSQLTLQGVSVSVCFPCRNTAGSLNSAF
jgi:hypothetical protein